MFVTIVVLLSTACLTSSQIFPEFPLEPIFPPMIPVQPLPLLDPNTHQSYLIAAPTKIRGGHPYRIHVSILADAEGPLSLKATIWYNHTTISNDVQIFLPGSTDLLLLKTKSTLFEGDYQLILEGHFKNGGRTPSFKHTRALELESRSVHIIIRTEKPIYRQDDVVRFRIIPLNPQLMPFHGQVDVFIYNPDGYLQRRYPALQSIFGVVSVAYQLAPELKFGDWKIRAQMGSSMAEVEFPVEEFNQPLFEVNITMPFTVLESEQFLYGSVEANFTWGETVRGNLSLHAFIIDPTGSEVEAPDWTNKPNPSATKFIEFFNGTYNFVYSMEALRLLSDEDDIDGKIIGIRATVSDYWYNETRVGFSQTRVYNDSVRMVFLGHQPQTFKPGMLFTTHLGVTRRDGAPVRHPVNVEVRRVYTFESGLAGQTESAIYGVPPEGVLVLETFVSKEVSQLTIEALALTPNFGRDDVSFEEAAVPKARLLVLRQLALRLQVIQVDTLTRNPTVGSYIIFNVKASYFLPEFTWIVTSKGLLLLSGKKSVRSSSYTFSVPVIPEMAPKAHIVVYNVLTTGEVIADKYTFAVDGISRNKMKVFVNHHKDYYKKTFEVFAYGDALAFVGFSAVERSLYPQMQGIAALSRADIMRSLHDAESMEYGSSLHGMTFVSLDGFEDHSVYFGTNTYGLDTDSMFRFADLMVLTNAVVSKISTTYCDANDGKLPCVSEGCYTEKEKCDGVWNCRDGTDEGNCHTVEGFYEKMVEFRRSRYNHIDRTYTFVCCWTDGNISPEGHLITDLPMPERPAHYVISVISMSEAAGLGVVDYEVLFDSIKPFHMVTETADMIHQGEQLGIRCALFNYFHQEIEVLLVLEGSQDYSFVEVGPFGTTHSYYARKVNASTIHHSVWMDTHSQTVVYFPIVPTRLGEISVTVTATTQIGEVVHSRNVQVIPDGVKTFFHTSVPIDLTNKGTLLKLMDIQVTENYTIPRQMDRLFVANSPKVTVTAVGDVFGPILDDTIDSITMINMPHQGGEMSIFSFAMNLYSLDFLRRTNQLTDADQDRLFTALNAFYQTICNYQDYYGPFHQFMNETVVPNSVWLTAFAVQIFEESRKLLQYSDWENGFYVDPVITEQCVRWILQHQTEDGSFHEQVLAPFDRKMSHHTWTPERWLEDRNVTLTAHVVIALKEVESFSNHLGNLIVTARMAAVRYLERNLDTLEDPYEIAIVTYALTVVDSMMKDTAFERLDFRKQTYDAYLFWGKDHIEPPKPIIRNNQPYALPHMPDKFENTNIATTAYALMVYNLRRSFLSDRIAAWLNTQRLRNAGFSSTQDTYMAVKALMHHSYFSNVREATDINITLTFSSSPGFEQVLWVRQDTLSQLQSVEVPNPWGVVTATARGTGYALLQLDVEYTVDKPQYVIPPPVRAFELFLDITYTGRNNSIMIFRPCARWTLLEESPQSGMACIEVDIPTGYVVFQPDLEDYCGSQPNELLRYAEFYNQKVTFFFDYLNHNFTCVDVLATRWFPVANQTRFLAVKVFDYYAPERFNTTIYEASALFSQSICHVCGSFQCPYCPNYNSASCFRLHGFAVLFELISLFWISGTMKRGRKWTPGQAYFSM